MIWGYPYFWKHPYTAGQEFFAIHNIEGVRTEFHNRTTVKDSSSTLDFRIKHSWTKVGPRKYGQQLFKETSFGQFPNKKLFPSPWLWRGLWYPQLQIAPKYHPCWENFPPEKSHRFLVEDLHQGPQLYRLIGGTSSTELLARDLCKRQAGKGKTHITTSWWFQPHLKNISQIGHLPQIGVKIKYIWNHHLDYIETYCFPKSTVFCHGDFLEVVTTPYISHSYYWGTTPTGILLFVLKILHVWSLGCGKLSQQKRVSFQIQVCEYEHIGFPKTPIV